MSKSESATASIPHAQIARLCADERTAVYDLADQPAFRVALARIGEDRHRLVMTIHHVVLDGWSFQCCCRRSSPASWGSACPQRCPTAGSSPGWPAAIWIAARAAWLRVLDGFDIPTLVAPPQRLAVGARATIIHGVRRNNQGYQRARPPARTTVTTVLQAAWAQLLTWLTGHHDVAFGTTVSGRSAEVVGAESMVGLLINTIPVRARLTTTTTTMDLLNQLQGGHNYDA